MTHERAVRVHGFSFFAGVAGATAVDVGVCATGWTSALRENFAGVAVVDVDALRDDDRRVQRRF